MKPVQTLLFNSLVADQNEKKKYDGKGHYSVPGGPFMKYDMQSRMRKCFGYILSHLSDVAYFHSGLVPVYQPH